MQLVLVSLSNAAIMQSDDPSYTLMATGKNYTAYFSPMNTNGFKYEVNSHSFSFLPREIAYTNNPGDITKHIGTARDAQIQSTSDMIYFDNPYGSGGQLSYLSNPLMIKEVYVLNELPVSSSNEDWMTLTSIALFSDDLQLKYTDESGNEKSWDGTKLRTNEIKFYDASGVFQFEIPQAIAKDAVGNTTSGHYLIYEEAGIYYISVRFSYESLSNMTLPLYLDISLADGQVAFGKPEYLLGETLEIWDSGIIWTNDRTVLYNPSGDVVDTFDIPNYYDIFNMTSRYTYPANAVGTWRAEFQTWVLGISCPFGCWKVMYYAYTNVKTVPIPTPTPTPTPTPVPTTTPGTPGILYGDIFDAITGNGIDGVTVTVDTGEYDYNPNRNSYAMNAASGMRSVTATADGYYPATQGIYITAGDFSRLDFWLTPLVAPTPTPTPTPTATPTIPPTPDPTYSGSISIPKDVYYPGDSIAANAIDLNPSLAYQIKWYKDDIAIGNALPVSSTTNKYTNLPVPGGNSAILSEYKVELVTSSGTFVSSDTAKVVVEPKDIKIAVILAEPSNDPHNKTLHNKDHYMTEIVDDLKSYYNEVSYGSVNIVINANDIYDNNTNWYKLGETAGYYGNNISADGSENNFKFVSDAIAISRVDINNYNVVIVVHANDSWQQHPKRWELMKTEAGSNRIIVSESELMGTWAHEIGHTLGTIFKPPYNLLLPDRYGDIDGKHSIGDWDLMGSGNWLGDMRNPDHMSSFSKEWLLWLKYKSIVYGSYWINSTATMKYGDDVAQYITLTDPKINYRNYYIIETRTNNPAYSKWDTSAPIPQGYNNAVVLYQVDEFKGQNATVNFIDNLTIGNIGSHSSYWDFANSIRIAAIEQRARTERTRPILEMNVSIAGFTISNKTGSIVTPGANLIGYIPGNAPSMSLNGELPLPDFDLHAYSADGKHVGVNYTTGIYENEIPGANASGDLFNGREWIFVPDNVKVQFAVDSRDIQIFLDAYPDLRQVTDGMQPYNLSIVYDSPDSTRYSTSVEQSIPPGEIRKYNYSIIKNPDGTYNVILDDTPPIIFNTAPENITNNMQISAEYNDNPGGSGIDTGSISLIIDDIDVTHDAMITSASISIKPTLNDGLHEILLNLGDHAGNNASAHWNFTLDATPPEIEISNISVMTNQTVYPAIKVIDARDVKPIIIALLNGAYYDGLPVAAEGEYELTVTVSDDAGNTATQRLQFTIDKTPPTVSITNPINRSFVGNIVNIAGIASDLHMEKTWLEIDSIMVSNSEEYSWDSRKVTDGMHEIRLNAEDKAGNAASASITVMVDNTQPDIFDLTPQDNSIVNSTYSISTSYNDAGSGIDINTFSIWIDGVDETGNAVVTDSSMQYKPSLRDGMHVVILSVNDNVGNSRIITISFELDTTSPETEINFPSDNSYARQTITISGIASDLHLDLVFLEIDGIKVSSASNYAWDTYLVKDGIHEIKLNAVDIVNNSASSSINVTVDNTPPVIQITPANGTVFYPDQKLTIDYNVTDATSGVASSYVAHDGIAVSKGDIIDLRNLSIGSHIIQVIAADNAGNNVEFSTTFIVKPIRAIIKIEPHTLNINSSGKWIKAEIVIPRYEANQINISSIRLNGIIPVAMRLDKDEEDDKEDDDDSLEKDDSELKVKFNRTLVQSTISPGYATLYISGKVNEAAFMGNDTIRVIGKHEKDSDHSETDFSEKPEKIVKSKGKGG